MSKPPQTAPSDGHSTAVDDCHGTASVRLLFFARAAELSGTSQAAVTLPRGAKLAQLQALVWERWPGLQPLAAYLHWAIEGRYAQPTDPVPRNAEVACFPPVSGG